MHAGWNSSSVVNDMYRILPKPWIFAFFAWIVLGLVFLSQTLDQVMQGAIRVGSIPGIAWIVFNALLFNPIWRWVWQKIPQLNRWFPDLNGEWDVELCSNWPRQLQLIEAAQSGSGGFDIRICPEDQLAPLPPIKLKAEISQTWWTFEMTMTNPSATTPIEGSDTIVVEPFAAKGLLTAGICYFYKQRNQTANVSDDTEFYGAARLTYDYKTDKLSGLTWTARMWPRAMNTAGPITFTRAP